MLLKFVYVSESRFTLVIYRANKEKVEARNMRGFTVYIAVLNNLTHTYI